MPLVTLTVVKPKPREFKDSALRAVHTAFVAVGVPAEDRFQRVLELAAEAFRFDASYPDVQGARTEDARRGPHVGRTKRQSEAAVP